MNMDRRQIFFFIFTLVLCPLSYIIFIQKPALPEYVRNFLHLGGSPFSNLAAQPKKEIKLSVPILMYHYVEDVTDERDTLRQSMATRPIFFEEQLKYLKNAGYTSISLSDLREALAGTGRIPEKSVILTFDDGYRDFYTDAFPLLKKYKIKSINYIIVNHIGRSGNLTEEMVREMLDSGLVEIGCHTLDHVYLPKERLAEARRQLVDCKKQLTSRFGVEVTNFAYPGGYYNSDIVKLIKEAGFETAVGTVPGVMHYLDDIYTIKRLRTGNLDAAVFGKHILGPKAE